MKERAIAVVLGLTVAAGGLMAGRQVLGQAGVPAELYRGPGIEAAGLGAAAASNAVMGFQAKNGNTQFTVPKGKLLLITSLSAEGDGATANLIKIKTNGLSLRLGAASDFDNHRSSCSVYPSGIPIRAGETMVLQAGPGEGDWAWAYGYLTSAN